MQIPTGKVTFEMVALCQYTLCNWTTWCCSTWRYKTPVRLFRSLIQQGLNNYLVFAPSEFAIINTDPQSDFDTESRLILRDQSNRKLNLKLNYVCVISFFVYLWLINTYTKSVP